MHKFVSKFDELNTRAYKREVKEKDIINYADEDYIKIPTGNTYMIKFKYYTDANWKPQEVVIVDNNTAKIIESKYHVLSVFSTKSNTKYGLVGSVFSDCKQVRDCLNLIGSEEVKNE